jgi:hypothetical protein
MRKSWRALFPASVCLQSIVPSRDRTDQPGNRSGRASIASCLKIAVCRTGCNARPIAIPQKAICAVKLSAADRAARVKLDGLETERASGWGGLLLVPEDRHRDQNDGDDPENDVFASVLFLCLGHARKYSTTPAVDSSALLNTVA